MVKITNDFIKGYFDLILYLLEVIIPILLRYLRSKHDGFGVSYVYFLLLYYFVHHVNMYRKGLTIFYT